MQRQSIKKSSSIKKNFLRLEIRLDIRLEIQQYLDFFKTCVSKTKLFFFFLFCSMIYSIAIRFHEAFRGFYNILEYYKMCYLEDKYLNYKKL